MAVYRDGLKIKRCLTFLTGLVECLCFSGAMFGWASLVFVLKTEGYFSYLCVNTTDANATRVLDCSGQEEQFSNIFTVSSFLINFLTLPNGFIFDWFGTTVARLVGIPLYTVGTLMFAFATPATSNLLFAALPFLAVGGIMLLVTNMQVGNLFGSRRSTIITLYNGAFDSSSAVFLVIKILHESGISLRSSFLFLSACSVIHLLRTFFLLPKKQIPHPLPDGYTYGVTCCKSKSLVDHNSTQTTQSGSAQMPNEKTPNDDAPVNQEKTVWQCVLSRLFLLHLLWLSVIQLRHLLFIGTLNPLLHRLTEGKPSLVSRYLNAFALTQLCGVLCAPWNGLIMDRHKGKPRAEGETEEEADVRASVLSLVLTSIQCVLFSISAATPYLPLQYLTFILQVINRSFLYGGNAAFISVAFPSIHFGKLYGMILALSSVFSLLQYPCFILVTDFLDGDPLYVNIALVLLSLITFIHPISVYLHCRRPAS
ncbi:solute carrier family 43 member 3b [Brachionichthys hirsutus]|uniref:solute carrier family 43 member 3b n=1 Tax=Brachionichthys hirsutus TaxID=412623 RepID=UPI0036043DF7